jgi:hypothetical protein
MIPSITIYDPSTGAILRVVTGPEDCLAINVFPGEVFIEGRCDGQTQYVANGTAADKQPMTPVVTGSTITNLPIPCTARIEGVPYEIADGVLELDADMPGPYEITLEAVPYLTCKVTIG